MWNVYVDNKLEKSYPFKIQAVVYCYLRGYVSSGYDDWERNSIGNVVVLNDRVSIKQER